MNINRVKTLKVNSEGFILDSSTGNSCCINAMGLFVINSLKSGMPYLQMICKMTKCFDMDGPTAILESEHFLEGLESKKLI